MNLVFKTTESRHGAYSISMNLNKITASYKIGLILNLVRTKNININYNKLEKTKEPKTKQYCISLTEKNYNYLMEIKQYFKKYNITMDDIIYYCYCFKYKPTEKQIERNITQIEMKKLQIIGATDK